MTQLLQMERQGCCWYLELIADTACCKTFRPPLDQ